MRHRLLVSAVAGAAVAAILLVVIVVAVVRRGDHHAAPLPAPAVTTPSLSSPSPSLSPSPSPPPDVSSSSSPTSGPTGDPTMALTRSPAPAVPGPPRGLLGKDIDVIPTSQPIVALTFDAGSNADGLPAILRTLVSEKVRATFFLTGSFADRHPDAVRSIVAAGHRLGNHTATHPYATRLTDAALRVEVATGQRQVLAAGGTDTRPLFRFPYGDRDARTIAAVNGAGYVAVRWTVDTLGWKGTDAGITVPQIVSRVVAAARPGEIVLMHIGSHPEDRSTLDAEALPAVIDQLRSRGYRFVTLDALLA
ncbi:polysaccharide deacetylase family protein [Micromonospora sp. NPDC049799]|uniref:polysaccharide deacetylase family protein n=1 Tax=Micromonospora sp. NPDC049799 TaxID=3154741 RepID=UPI0033F3878A